MANEDKKDFKAMLRDSKDMPKIQIITDRKSIEKYGGDGMYFAPPMDYDAAMRRVPYGKLTTVGDIRAYFAKQSGAEAQKEKLEAEGHTVLRKGRTNLKYVVMDDEKALYKFT